MNLKKKKNPSNRAIGFLTLFEIYNCFQSTDCFCNERSMRRFISDRLSVLSFFISENIICFQHPYFKTQSSRKEKTNKYLSLKAKEKIKTVGLSRQRCSRRGHAPIVAGMFYQEPRCQASPIHDSSAASQTHMYTAQQTWFSTSSWLPQVRNAI